MWCNVLAPISANDCLASMCSWLQPYFSCCCEITAAFVIQQLQSASCVTYPHIMSALQLIEKVHNSCFCKYLTVVQEFHWNFFFNFRFFFCIFLWPVWLSCIWRSRRCYVTGDTGDVDPSWCGQFMCEWVKRQHGNKRIGLRVKSYKSLYCFTLLFSFLWANHM